MIQFEEDEARTRYVRTLQVAWTLLLGVSLLPALTAQVSIGAYRHASGLQSGLESLRFMDSNGVAQDVPVTAVEAHYRSCPFFKTHVALGAVLRGTAAERAAIEQAIARAGGNMMAVTRELGISRSTLYRKLRKYGLAR